MLQLEVTSIFNDGRCVFAIPSGEFYANVAGGSGEYVSGLSRR